VSAATLYALAGLLFTISALLNIAAGNTSTGLMFICIGMMFIAIAGSKRRK
jgi:hypothetical protein